MLLELLVETGEMGGTDILSRLQLKDRKHLREQYMGPALAQGLIEMTVPDRPRSRLQRYRLTARGQQWLQSRQKPSATS